MRYGSNDYEAIHAALQKQEPEVLPLERGGIDPERTTEKAGAGDSVSGEAQPEETDAKKDVISQMIAFTTKGENDA